MSTHGWQELQQNELKGNETRDDILFAGRIATVARE